MLTQWPCAAPHLALPCLAPLSPLLTRASLRVDRTVEQDGCTALMRASSRGHVGLVEVLLAKGADVNAQDKVHALPMSMTQHGEPSGTLQAAYS